MKSKQTKRTEWYRLQVRDFIPFLGIYNYTDRVPKKELMSFRDIINNYVIIAGQVAIGVAIGVGGVTGLEKLFK